MVLKSTEEINHGRKRIRLIFTIAILPFLLVAAVMAWKVASMYVETQKAVENFNTAQQETTSSEEKTKLLEETVQLVDGLDTEVFAERWVVSYNYGTVLLGEKKNNAGVEKLKQALSEIQSDRPEVCLIYANLAIGYEQLGDEYSAQQDTEQASYWYDQAILVTQTAEPLCSPPPSPDQNENQDQQSSDEQTPDQQGGESLQETKERVQGKQDALKGDPEQGDGTGDTSGENATDSSPDQSDLDKVREQMDESAEEKAEQDAGSSNDSGEPGSNTWEKPW